MHKIQSLLAEGKSSTEVIALGYKASTVYKAQRQMVQGRKPGRSSGNGVSTEVQQSPAKGQAEHPKPMTTRVHEPPGPDGEADPEIVQLKIDLRKAQLEGKIAEVRAPIALEARLAALENKAKELNQ